MPPRWPWKAVLVALLAALFLLTPTSAVPSRGTQDIYLRLTTPTSSSSTKENTAAVTIMAVAP